MKRHVFVLGGDGFCGWPVSLKLSKAGYDVTIIDNLSRRKINIDLEVDSLTPVQPINNRISAWKEVTGKDINFVNLDLSKDYDQFLALIKDKKPETIAHFAEQRSAPYSMKNSKFKRFTVDNNVSATSNVLAGIVESGLDIHLVHLGTMGVYGYGTAGMKIPEGYLSINVDTPQGKKNVEILYPANAGSVYHMTKTLDALMFHYYNKNDETRITDLHQGIVWGVNTDETSLDSRLANRFSYDGDYGTVLNRFIIQAAVKHPLTVHGTGGQTRAFINIRDTVNCIMLAIANPPAKGERVEIFNQVTETHRVRDLAKLIADKTGAEIRYYDNPRNEDAENELRVVREKFKSLGLKPITLSEGLVDELFEVAKEYADNCQMDKIICTSTWSGKEPDLVGKS